MDFTLDDLETWGDRHVGYTPVRIIGVLVVIVIESLLRDETGATVAHYRPEIHVS